VVTNIYVYLGIFKKSLTLIFIKVPLTDIYIVIIIEPLTPLLNSIGLTDEPLTIVYIVITKGPLTNILFVITKKNCWPIY